MNVLGNFMRRIRLVDKRLVRCRCKQNVNLCPEKNKNQQTCKNTPNFSDFT